MEYAWICICGILVVFKLCSFALVALLCFSCLFVDWCMVYLKFLTDRVLNTLYWLLNTHKDETYPIIS
jgi:hypothetical protein